MYWQSWILGSLAMALLLFGCERPLDHPCDIESASLDALLPAFSAQVSIRNEPIGANGPELLIAYGFANGRLGSVPTSTAHGIQWWQEGQESQKVSAISGQAIRGQNGSCANCAVRIKGADFPEIGYYYCQPIAFHCIQEVVGTRSPRFFVGPDFEWKNNPVSAFTMIQAGDQIRLRPQLRNTGIKEADSLRIRLQEITPGRNLIESISKTQFSMAQLPPDSTQSLVAMDSVLEIRFRPDISENQVASLQIRYDFRGGSLRDTLQFTIGEAVVLDLVAASCESVTEQDLTIDDERAFSPGDTLSVQLELRNLGILTAESITVVTQSSDFTLVNPIGIDRIAGGEAASFPMRIAIPAATSEGKHSLQLIIKEQTTGTTLREEWCFFVYRKSSAKPELRYFANGYCGQFPCYVNLRATEVEQPENIMEYRWFVDDVMVSEAPNFNYSFPRPDSFTIKLQIGGISFREEFSQAVYVKPMTGIDQFSIGNRSGVGFFVHQQGAEFLIPASGNAGGSGDFYTVIKADTSFEFLPTESSNPSLLVASNITNLAISPDESSYFACNNGEGNVLKLSGFADPKILQGSPVLWRPTNVITTASNLVVAVGNESSAGGDSYLKILNEELELLDTLYLTDEWMPFTRVFESTTVPNRFYVLTSLDDWKTFMLYFGAWDGNELREVQAKVSDGTKLAFFSNALVTSEGKIIVAGRAQSNLTDLALFSIDADGSINDDLTIVRRQDPFRLNTLINSARQQVQLLEVPNSNAFVLCCPVLYNDLAQVYLAKFDKDSFELEWESFLNFPTVPTRQCIPLALGIATDGGFLITGTTSDESTQATSSQVLFIKTDAYGRILD